MTAYEQRSYPGAAADTVLTGDITNVATAFSVTAGTGAGYPDGTGGPFFVIIDYDNSKAEKVRCSGRVNDTFTVAGTGGGRGQDGTSAQAHTAPAKVRAVWTATDAQEANRAAAGTVGLVTAKGDLLTGSGANTLARTAAGANGSLVQFDSTQAGGVKATTPIVGNPVGTTDAQTLTNKTLAPATAAGIAAVVKGLVSQTGDLQEWQDSTGTPLAKINSVGSLLTPLGIVGDTTVNPGAQFNVIPKAATSVALVAQGTSGQSADLQQWQNNAGTPLAKVDAAGNISATNLTSAWTAYTPTFTNITGGAGVFAYNLVGHTLYIRGTFTAGNATAGGQVTISLPAGLTSAVAGSSWIPGGTVGGGAQAPVPWTTTHSTTMTTAGLAYAAGQSLNGLMFTGIVEVA